MERFPYVKTRLMPRDKRWVHLEDSRLEQYRNGCEEFLDYAFSHAAIDDTIRCPCNKCKNKKRYDRDTVHYHLLQRRMYKPYGVGLWTLHNELKEDELGDAITKIDENKVDALRAGGIGMVEGDVVDGLADLHKVSSYAIAGGSDDSTANDSKRSIETLKPKGLVSMMSTRKKVRKSPYSNFSFGPTLEEFNDLKRKMAKLQ